MADDPPPPAAADEKQTPTSATTNGTTPTPDGAPLPQPKKYLASLSLPNRPRAVLPNGLAEALLGLEKSLGMPLWLLIQDADDPEHDLCGHVEDEFFKARHELPRDEPVALLVDSPGGYAACAYGIAKLLQRRCGSFVAIVPKFAKSAATLLCLGACEIIMAEHAQLGPLDAQILDRDREERSSALNETQSLERLNAAALESVDQAMFMLTRRTRKRTDILLPHCLKFAAEMMRPLLEKVDVVQYTNRLRSLKVAEEYAVRLLRPTFPDEEAERIAGHLVEMYPEHGFVIDYDEAQRIGLHVKEPTTEQATHLDQILLHLTSMSAFGRVIEVGK